jgi:hypothetical protein
VPPLYRRLKVEAKVKVESKIEAETEIEKLKKDP